MRKSHSKTDKLSRILIYSGLLIIVITVISEAYHYPWATLFGGVPQSDSSLPDPPPIIWENGDHEGNLSSTSGNSTPAILPGQTDSKNTIPTQYTELGIIKIPKLNLAQHILEGTEKQLHYGVGHVIGTSNIGKKGNCAIAGHNTTSFRYLDKLNTGDKIFLKTNKGVFTYSIFRIFTVLPTDTYVLNHIDGEDSALTLITCTPYLTGTHRLIVQARLTNSRFSESEAQPNEPGYIKFNSPKLIA